MKILIVSDTHGDIDNLLKGIKQIEKPDMLLHLGDYVEDGINIGKEMNIPTTIVKGNGDYTRNDYNYDEIVEIGDKRIFMTHGHKYNVNFSLSNLFYKGKENRADYILFGHTHIPIIEKINDITIMNPGSPSSPRGYDNRKTFGMIIIGNTIEEKIIEINL